MSRPWMSFYVRDYLADTVHLSTVEHGAYLMLIMHYWLHGGLPSEDAKLARIARLSLSEWTEIRQTVADFFDENWRHKRVEAELAAAEEKYQKRVKAGQRGGKASASLRQSRSNAEAMLEPKPSHAEGRLNQPQAQAQAQKEESQGEVAVPAPASEEDRFWARLPVLEAKGVNRTLCSRILKLSGTDFVAVNRALDRAERARDPDRYLAGVARKLEIGDRTFRLPVDPGMPIWVKERHALGIPVEREGRHWRSQGELLNDAGGSGRVLIVDRLRALGIVIPSRPGEHRTLCPRCSSNRRKKHDRCLSVRMQNDGAVFHCWHCDWSGGVSDSQRRRSGLREERPQNQRGDFGTARRRLRNAVLP